MARVLRVLNLKIRTTRGWQTHEYDLDAQVVVIHGPADTGKSSIADAIGFGLGVEDVRFRGAVDLHLMEVVLTIKLGSRSYTLRRLRSTSSRVEVIDEVGDLVGRFPVAPRGAAVTVSDWLFDNLGLAEGFAALGAKATFHSAVWPYLHRNQFDIDRYIVLPSSADQLRLDALQVMTGIVDTALAKRRTEVESIDREIKQRQRRNSNITKFLEASQATDPAAVRAALVDLRAQEAAAAARLSQLKASSTAALTGVEQWNRRQRQAFAAVDQVEQQLLRARRDLGEIEAELDKVDQALRALAVLEGAEPADPYMLKLPLTTCPECKSGLLDDVPPPGHCSLCRRPLRGHEHLETRIRLQQKRQEIEGRLSALQTAEEAAQKAVDRVRSDLAALVAARDEQTAQPVAPHVDAIAAATGELAAVRQRLTDLRQVEAALQRLKDEQQEIETLQSNQRQRHEELRAAESNRDHREWVAETLTDIFRRTIADIGLPNATGRARIDADTLLPWVDEQPFEARGGGARVAVSVAYSLALLSYTLEIDQSTIPSLLIIDSPQKNLGTNNDDRELARRVYQKFLDALQTRGAIGDGRFERPFQLIIIDNDRPKVKGVSKVHELKYRDGFIKDLESPHGIPEGDVPLPFHDLAD